MRFANYIYHGRKINNLGDHVQILTIDYLYSIMGIPKSEIVYIDIEELSSYSGPDVYLPVSMPLVNYCEHGVAGMFSEHIYPVFFGVTTPKTSLLPEEVEYYKKHEPIGCRDEQAYSTMCKYDVKAYLGGCLTVTLPKRESSPLEGKTFIVDIPEKLKEFVPQKIADKADLGTHLYYGNMEDPTAIAIDRYKQYYNEANLIITGLLHGAVPCMAFGIPVVLARDCMSYRFGWLESLLKIYTPEEYSQIDWHPEAVDIEVHKQHIISLFVKRMRGEDASDEINYVHNFYSNRTKNTYVNDVFFTLKEFIDTNWKDKDAEYEYAVWGLTHMAEITVNYISDNYPNATLTHVYDIKPGKVLNGVASIHPDNIKLFPNETVFVTTVSAASSAKHFFQEINKPEKMYKTLEVVR